MVYYGGFFIYLSDYLYTFGKTMSFKRSSHPFWKLLCPNNFSSLSLNLSINFPHSLLQYLRGNCLRKLQFQMRGHD